MRLFSESMFPQVEPIMQKIFAHPFVQELSEGSLPREKFIYYMQQDSLYLIEYARALALIAAKAHEEKHIEQGLQFSQGALLAERTLHEHYFSLFDVSPCREKRPACAHYTAHLLSIAALDSQSEGMAALLPCFWIYNEVGKRILAVQSSENPYATWIETYAGEGFAEATQNAIAYTDALAHEVSGALRARMESAFTQSCRMEYYFWEDAYTLKRWSV